MPAEATDRPIRTLHLADIHFRVGRAWDADPLLRVLAGFIEGEVEAGLAVISGDLDRRVAERSPVAAQMEGIGADGRR